MQSESLTCWSNCHKWCLFGKVWTLSWHFPLTANHFLLTLWPTYGNQTLASVMPGTPCLVAFTTNNSYILEVKPSTFQWMVVHPGPDTMLPPFPLFPLIREKGPLPYILPQMGCRWKREAGNCAYCWFPIRELVEHSATYSWWCVWYKAYTIEMQQDLIVLWIYSDSNICK